MNAFNRITTGLKRIKRTAWALDGTMEFFAERIS